MDPRALPWAGMRCPVGAIPNAAAPPTRDKDVDDSIGVPRQPGISLSMNHWGAPTGHGIPARGETPGMGWEWMAF